MGISNKILKWREASFKTKKMSPNLGFDRFGGHLVQTLPQTELKKRISKYFGKRCTSIGTLRISISFLGFFFCKVNRAWAWTMTMNRQNHIDFIETRLRSYSVYFY